MTYGKNELGSGRYFETKIQEQLHRRANESDEAWLARIFVELSQTAQKPGSSIRIDNYEAVAAVLHDPNNPEKSAQLLAVYRDLVETSSDAQAVIAGFLRDRLSKSAISAVEPTAQTSMSEADDNANPLEKLRQEWIDDQSVAESESLDDLREPEAPVSTEPRDPLDELRTSAGSEDGEPQGDDSVSVLPFTASNDPSSSSAQDRFSQIQSQVQRAREDTRFDPDFDSEPDYITEATRPITPITPEQLARPQAEYPLPPVSNPWTQTEVPERKTRVERFARTVENGAEAWVATVDRMMAEYRRWLQAARADKSKVPLFQRIRNARLRRMDRSAGRAYSGSLSSDPSSLSVRSAPVEGVVVEPPVSNLPPFADPTPERTTLNELVTAPGVQSETPPAPRPVEQRPGGTTATAGKALEDLLD